MKNIIITGGGFANKGAQAMTFITISELSRRFPNHNIFLLTYEKINNKEFGIYSNKVFCLSWYPLKFAKAQNNLIIKAICKFRNRKEYNEAVSVYSNCDLMIDISGYALGSNWPDKICSDFLDNLEFAKAFDIPVVLMPQSFGPFDYNKDSIIDRRISELLPFVKSICAREEEGYNLLKERYHLANVVKKPDIVLNSKIDLFNEFSNSKSDIPKIKPNSIAIIPNENIIRIYGKEKTLKIYSCIIEFLLNNGLNVYLLSHSNNDKIICKDIKKLFDNDEGVICLLQDFSCIVFNEIVKQFKFCIASRFHSIVHSYKNQIPCIVIGWAIKYKILVNQFLQDDFLFDVRDELEINKILSSVAYMIESFKKQSSIISQQLNEIQKENVFDILPDKI